MTQRELLYPQSITEVPAFYDAQLRAVEVPYVSILQSLGDWAEGAELAYGQPVEARLNTTVSNVQAMLGKRTAEYVDVIGAIPDVVMEMPDFAARDKKMFHRALNRLTFASTLSEIDALPVTDELRLAMRVALDQRVLMNARNRLNSKDGMADVNMQAATNESRRAMRATFDASIFRSARNTFDHKGAARVIETHSATGEPYVTHAMKTRIDQKVLQGARGLFAQNHGRHLVEDYATSQTAAQWLLHELYGDPVRPNGNNQQRRQRRQSFEDNQNTFIPPRGYQRVETPPRPSREEQDRELYATVIGGLPIKVAQTLDGMPRAEVLRVVRTIYAIREDAVQKQKEVSDRAIFLRFARRSNNREQTNPDHVRATQIAQLLMKEDKTFYC